MSIKSNALIIKYETTEGQNTADRIGSSLVEIADDLTSKQSAIDLNTVKTGITPIQSNEITANNTKVSYTDSAEVAANSSKVGITSQQSADIVSNNAKTGITSSQTNSVIANTAKVGYTEALVSANTSVYANTIKSTYPSADSTKLAGIEVGAEVNTVNSSVTGEPAGSDVILNIVSLTQAEYDAGTKIATTFYIIN